MTTFCDIKGSTEDVGFSHGIKASLSFILEPNVPLSSMREK